MSLIKLYESFLKEQNCTKSIKKVRNSINPLTFSFVILNSKLYIKKVVCKLLREDKKINKTKVLDNILTKSQLYKRNLL